MLVIKNNQALPVQGNPLNNYYDDYTATHVILLRSPIIIEKAVKKKDLASLRTFEGSGDPVGNIINSLAINRDKDSAGAAGNIIFISYRGPVAEDCGKILTAILESYQEFLNDAYRNVGDQVLAGITQARDTLQGSLKTAEEEYREFRRNTPLIFHTKDGGNLTLDRMADIEQKAARRPSSRRKN